jgi:integrase
VAAAKAKTFRQCAEGFIKDNEASWTNAKHRHDWHASLSMYVFPVLGNLPVAAIDTPVVLKVIKPLWERVPETASRVRGRIEAVLGWATVHRYRSGDNPARWGGLLEHALPARSAVAKVEHHAALPYADVPGFMAKMQQKTSVSAACARFVVLTAARRNEAVGALWDEIDLDKAVWTIPGNRMKAGKEHRVPLSDAVLAVLKAMAEIRQSDFVFPGDAAGQPVHGASVVGLAKRVAGDTSLTLHGFRSSFRDWCGERTNFPREVCEQALAHAIPNAVEAAYRRSDLIEKRRRLMDAWAAYCAAPQAAGRVVPIRG